MKNFKRKSKPFIVAEIGNNHEGSLKNAFKLIDSAKKAGADAVKFQIFNPYKFTSPKDKKRIAQLKKFALKRADVIKLKKKCDKLDIVFFATPLDVESASFLNNLQSFFKISSGDNNYFDLLKKIRSFRKPAIISTGLMNYREIVKVVRFFKKFKFYKKKENLCVMHCVSAYPAKKDKINLNSIPYLKKRLKDVTIGYSDHTTGYDISIFSYILGAEIIEKHFTLSNNFSSFRDHKISLNPKSFKDFVKKISKLSVILGNLDKKINMEELNNYSLMRRKIIFKKNLKTGSKIKRKDLLMLRSSEPGTYASEIKKVLGKKLTKDVNRFDNLLSKDFMK